MTNTLARKIGNNIKMNLFSEVDYLRGSLTPSECTQLVPVVWQINYLQTTLRLKYSNYFASLCAKLSAFFYTKRSE